MRDHKQPIAAYLFLCFAGVLFVLSVAACGKSATNSAVGSNIALQVINLSPDLRPINVHIAYARRNTYPYSYPTPSGYFSIAADTPIQIRSSEASVSTVNWVTQRAILKPNVKYTMFITGFRADSNIRQIFTTDTASPAAGGRGKIRFVNATSRQVSLDVTANGTSAFTRIAMDSVSKFKEIPPGVYEFKITQTGSPANVLAIISNQSVQDGKIYTIYTYGVAGRLDSARFGGGILLNK